MHCWLLYLSIAVELRGVTNLHLSAKRYKVTSRTSSFPLSNHARMRARTAPPTPNDKIQVDHQPGLLHTKTKKHATWSHCLPAQQAKASSWVSETQLGRHIWQLAILAGPTRQGHNKHMSNAAQISTALISTTIHTTWTVKLLLRQKSPVPL